MILGPLCTTNPFGDPDLFWCETGFAIADLQTLCHQDPALGMVRVSLPDDLGAAVPKRRSEFLSGRLCASYALRQAGLDETVGRKGRAPVWPNGCTGSITHSRDRAIAAVSTRYDAVGLDCEAMVPADRAHQLAAAIFTEAEAGLRPDVLPFASFFTLVFSAKESLYKALSAQLSRVPDFAEVSLTGIEPGLLTLVLDGATHRARFRLSTHACVTLVCA